MKRYLMVFLAVLLFSTAASAQVEGYLCLFADIDHTTWCATAATIPGSITMYIYMLPEASGSFGAEFMLDYPDDPDIFSTLETYNPDITVAMGGLASGISLGFNECKMGWFMLASQPIITMSANQGIIAMLAHPTSNGTFLADCGEAHARYPATVFNSLYINYAPSSPECSETATEESTWGAIKGIYAD